MVPRPCRNAHGREAVFHCDGGHQGLRPSPPAMPRQSAGNEAAGRVVKAAPEAVSSTPTRARPADGSALAFACWNSGSLITPLSRNSASRVVSSAAPERYRWGVGFCASGGSRRSVAELF